MLPDDTPTVTRDELEVQIDSLLDQLRWTHALLSIMVENEGGVVHIASEVVDSYPLDTELQVSLDAQSSLYSIAIVEQGDVVSDVTA